MNQTPPRAGGTTPLQKILLLLFGLFLVLAFEGALRVAGIGGASRLFVVEKDLDGKKWFVTNQSLNERLFFPVTGAESDFPRPQIPYARFTAEKSDDTYRMFVVGASSSVGFPFSSNVAFCNWLGEMIAEGAPRLQVEAINTSMTAISSYQVGQWVSEIARHYDPDLVVIYTGHNELYGVLGAGSAMSVGSNRTLTGIFLKLQSTATYSLVAKLLESVRKPPQGGPKGQPLEALTKNREVRPESELHTSVVENFRSNLEAMAAVTRKRNVPVIFCTPVSNRSGCAPMVPLHGTDFSESARPDWDRHLRYGETKLRAGDVAGARAAFEKALALDPTHAGIHYRLGLVALAEGNVDAARQSFEEALLRDALHLRACEPLVETVREVAAAAAERGDVALADCVTRFDAEAERGVAGSDLVFEHVHPNGRGHYLIASEIYRTLQSSEFAPEAISGESASIALKRGMEYFAPLAGYSDIDRSYANQFMGFMLRQWPFDGTYRNTEAILSIQSDFDEAKAALDEVEAQVFAGHKVGDTVLHLRHRLGLAYLDAGRPADAAREFAIIAELIPTLGEVQQLLARSLIESGQEAAAIQVLGDAISARTLTAETIAGDPALKSIAARF